MRTRRILMAFTAVAVQLVAFAVCASAQGADLKTTTPEQRAAVLTEIMKAKLDLSADQLPKVSALNLKYAQKMQPLLESSERPLAKVREAREIAQQKDAELGQILSPAQLQKYLAAKEEMRQLAEDKLRKKATGGGE